MSADNLTGELGTKLTEMEEKLKKYPPIDPEKLRRLLVYSFSELKGYAGLSAREKLILDVSEFEALRAWAFGRKEGSDGY